MEPNMQRTIIFLLTQLLLFATPLSQVWAADAPADTTDAPFFLQGQADGRAAADSSRVDDVWAFYGLLGGMTLGPIGTGIIIGISQKKNDCGTVPETQVFAVYDSTYRAGFCEGYNREMSSDRRTNSFVGGVLGMVVAGMVALYVQQRMSRGHWGVDGLVVE